MRTLYLAMLSICLLLLCSCQHQVKIDHDSYFYSVPVGSNITLNKPVTIKSNLGRTFFQNGKETSKNKLNIYYPHCSLTVNTLLDKDRKIKPTTFEIYKVIDEEEYAQLHILYAAISFSSAFNGPSIIGQASYYYLRSESETDVRALECVQWGSPHEVEHVSINDIKQSLGSIFTLTLNE